MTHSPPSSATDDTGSVKARRSRSTRTVLALAAAGAVVAAIMVVLVGGIVAEPGAAPVAFVTQPDFQPGATPPCILHQTDSPNAPYQGGEHSQSRPQLTFLAYYTAVGRKPFCDGRGATGTDKVWAKLYVQLTSNPDNVSSILG